MNTAHCFSDNAVPLNLLKQRAFNLRWAEVKGDVIPLTAADPDFAVAEPIRETIARYAHEGVLSYTPSQGTTAFREAVAHWLTTRKMFACDASEVIATDSAAAAMQTVANALLHRGDEAIIFDPVDFLFATVTERAGASAIRVPLTMRCDDEAILHKLEQARSRRTRVLWLCNPHNPLGKVFAKSLLLKIGDWAISNKITVVSDEIWSDIVYAPFAHTSIASLFGGDRAQFISIYGFSKNFGLAGLRIGCIVCHSPRLRRIMLEQSGTNATIAGASVLSQVAVVAALGDCLPWLDAFVDHLHQQRDYLFQWLSQFSSISLSAPQGTYVAFPNIAAFGLSASALCERLHQGGVAVVPGERQWFGPGADGHIRLCFSTSRGILSEAMKRMTPVFQQLQQECNRL